MAKVGAKSMNALVVVPAYNEEGNIRKVLEELLRVQKDFDIAVINDGSWDDTGRLAEQFPVRVLFHPCNLGYGAALQSGFRYAERNGYTHLVQFDADGQHRPQDIATVLNALTATDAEVVLGSRFLGDGNLRLGQAKMLAIGIFRLLIRVFTGARVTDPTSGLRGLSRNVFAYYAVKDRFPNDFPDANVVLEMLLRKIRIREVPVGNRTREQGNSMHAGFGPILYMFTIMLSILVVLLNFLLSDGGRRA